MLRSAAAAARLLESLPSSRAVPTIALQHHVTDVSATALALSISNHGARLKLASLAIRNCPNLQKEGLQKLITSALRHDIQLRFLDLGFCPALADELPSELLNAGLFVDGTTLQELNIQGCGMTHQGVAVLATDLMIATKTITSSVVDDLHQQRLNPPQDGPCALSSTVPPLSAAPPPIPLLSAAPPLLPKLPLSEGAVPFQSSRLQCLDLSNNVISGSGPGLAALLQLPELQDLKLCGCRLTRDDIRNVGEGLPLSGLLGLDLGHNGIASGELRVFTAPLQRSGLQRLGLQGNAIGRGAALQALGSAWGRRPPEGLCLEQNRLEPDELFAFMQSLSTSSKKGGIRFGNSFCRLGCPCNGRGEVM